MAKQETGRDKQDEGTPPREDMFNLDVNVSPKIGAKEIEQRQVADQEEIQNLREQVDAGFRELPDGSIEIDPEAMEREGEYDQDVVESNLKMLREDMEEEAKQESFGGNTDNIEIDGKSYSCGTTIGYADPKIGRIVAFGTPQTMDKEILDNNSEIKLQSTIGRKHDIIVGFLHDTSLSKRGLKNIQKAIEEYNAAQGVPSKRK